MNFDYTAIGKRIKQLRLALNFDTQTDFGKKHSFSQVQVSHMENGKHIDEGTLYKLVVRTGVNFDWLVHGTGQMFSKAKFQYLPFIKIPAHAGFIESYGNENDEDWELHPVLGNGEYKGGLVFEVEGDSMAPQIRNGAKVIIKEVAKGDWNNISKGKVYAVLWESYFAIKRIPEFLPYTPTIRLVSDNPHVPPFDVEKEKIRAIFAVLKVEQKVE